MRKTIERKMIETKIHGFSVTIKEDGTPHIVALEPVTVYGNVKSATAHKILKNTFPDAQNVSVSKIMQEEVYFEISVDEFVKHAKKIDKNTTTEQENE